jgi:hypothetical protein
MLEYLSPASPPVLCELYPAELQRYYCTSDLALFRASVPHRQLQVANQGVFLIARGRCLRYLTFTDVQEHELPFTPISIGVSFTGLAWLLDDCGGLWSYQPSTREVQFLTEGILAISGAADAYVSQEGECYSGTGTTQTLYVKKDLKAVGTQPWHGLPFFCDAEGQWWYVREALVPMARPPCQVSHVDGCVHYLTPSGSLRWLRDEAPSSFHKLLANVQTVTGANGSVVAETKDHTYHFFMATVQLPYYLNAARQLTTLD